MNARRKVICVDMDGVMADALAEHLLRYNREFQESLTLEDLLGKGIWNAVPEDRLDALEQYIRSEDFFAVLEVWPDSQRVLQRLQQDFDIFITTAAMEVPSSFTAKYEWLERHFPFIPPSHIVFCGDKSILAGDFLIDDSPMQLRRFRGEGILFDSPSNVHVTEFRRVRNWLEVEKLFAEELSPKS